MSCIIRQSRKSIVISTLIIVDNIVSQLGCGAHPEWVSTTMQCTHGRLTTSVSQTYCAATPVMRFRSNLKQIPSPKEPLALYAKVACIYKFHYMYQAMYIGRRERQLGTLVLEYISARFERQLYERSKRNYVPQKNQL